MNIKEGIPDVLKLLKDKNNEVRGATVLAITELLKQCKISILISVPANFIIDGQPTSSWPSKRASQTFSNY
jgi:hypothetical protein